MRRIGLLVGLLVACVPGFGEPSSAVLDWLAHLPSGTSLNSAQVDFLLKTAANNHWNLFDLLDEVQPVLAQQDLRVHVSGDELRSASTRFRLGDHRIDTLFPLALVREIQVGSVARGEPAVEVFLSAPSSGFLEWGDFHLATEYGFAQVEGRALTHAFGVRVKNGWFTWDLEKIERVPDPRGLGDPNFIAIHLKGFLRPKRWQIDPVTVRASPQTARP